MNRRKHRYQTTDPRGWHVVGHDGKRIGTSTYNSYRDANKAARGSVGTAVTI